MDNDLVEKCGQKIMMWLVDGSVVEEVGLLKVNFPLSKTERSVQIDSEVWTEGSEILREQSPENEDWKNLIYMSG